MEENDIDKSTERTYSRDEVSEHNTKEDAWIIFDKDVFDISDFLDDPDQHPGGIQMILEHLGQDISQIFLSSEVHVHSERAKELFQFYKIGTVLQ